MAILDTVGRLGMNLLAMLQTRLELAAVEMEEEAQRFLGYLMLALLSLILFGIAMALLVLLVIIVFWESHRIAAVLGMAGVFALAGTVALLRLKSQLAVKPRLMGATLGELNKDINFVRNAGQGHEQ